MKVERFLVFLVSFREILLKFINGNKIRLFNSASASELAAYYVKKILQKEQFPRIIGHLLYLHEVTGVTQTKKPTSD